MFFAASTPVARRTSHVAALRSLDRFLDEALTVARTAAANVSEDDKAWTLTLDVPGVSREQLSIAIDGASVKVETVADAPRQYKKAYEFAQDVDAAASTAKLENGVLTLQLAKRVPESTATTLAIQ